MCGVVKGLGAHRHVPPNTALRQSAGPPCHSERSEESRSVLGSRRGIQLSSFPCQRRLTSFQSPFLPSIIFESDRQVLWRPRKRGVQRPPKEPPTTSIIQSPLQRLLPPQALWALLWPRLLVWACRSPFPDYRITRTSKPGPPWGATRCAEISCRNL